MFFSALFVPQLIGDFDGARIEEFITVLMTGIERASAQLVLIDITDMPLLDTAGAAGLLARHAGGLKPAAGSTKPASAGCP